MRKIIVTAVLVLLSACRTTTEPGAMDAKTAAALRFINGECPQLDKSPIEVPIDALVRDPSRYEGAIVKVTGVYYFGYEHSAIYSRRKEDPFVQDVRAGIWVYGISRAFSGKNLRVTGVFTGAYKGHLSAWPGAICMLSAAEVPPDAS